MICSGLNVVEVGTASMAASMAGMMFADNGARVIKIEPPTGDRLRTENPSGFLVWNRGKESLVLDLRTAEGQSGYRELVADADVVIEAFSPGTVERWGIGYDSLAAADPSLVYCSITGFGHGNGYSHLKGYEALVAAKLGLYSRGEFAPRSGPIMFTQPSAGYGAAMLATAGIAAALGVREQTGRGQRVDTSLAQGLEPVDYFVAMVVQMAMRAGGTAATDPRAAMMATRYGLLAVSSDGYFIQTSTVLPHQAKALTQAVGLDHLIELPQNAKMPMFDTAEDAQEWEDAIWAAFRSKTRDEWSEILLGFEDVPFEFACTSEEGTRHPQIVHNGDVIALDDPAQGTVRQVGPLAHFTSTPSSISRSAPALGSNDGPLASRPALTSDGAAPKHALDGVTIVDFGYFYAMPYGTAMAASMGARVIKIEDLNGDPHRVSFGPEVASVKTMSDKESLSIDLRSAAGREAAHKLLATADAFVVGFRSGVAEKVGLDYATLRAINPRLVYLHAAGYGIDGPYARRALYAQAAQTVAGSFGRQVGHWANPELNRDMSLMEIQAVVAPRLGQVIDGDSNASLAVLAALSLGLLHQRRSGEGQFLSTSMIGANAWTYSDDFCTYETKPPIPQTDSEYMGINALYRVYPTAEEWVCLVVPTDAEWLRFLEASGRTDLADDARFATAAARAANDEALVAELTALFATRTASDWESALAAADVGCVSVNPNGAGMITCTDPVLRAGGLVVDSPHPTFGTVTRWAPLVTFSETPGTSGPACLRGEHNRSILSELGYSPERIDELEAAGVISGPAT